MIQRALPFAQYRTIMKTMEIRRRKGLIPDDKMLMTLSFIDDIGASNFLDQAK